MKIKNTHGLTALQMQQEIEKGGKYVYFTWTISFIFFTIKKTTDVLLIRAGENARMKGLPYTIISALFGWWGIPNGPIATFKAIRMNLKGGKEVTNDVMDVVAGHLQYEQIKASRVNKRFTP